MAGRNRCAVEELGSLGTAQGVGLNAKQKLAVAWRWHCFFDKFDLLVPNKGGNPTAGRYCIAYRSGRVIDHVRKES